MRRRSEWSRRGPWKGCLVHFSLRVSGSLRKYMSRWLSIRHEWNIWRARASWVSKRLEASLWGLNRMLLGARITLFSSLVSFSLGRCSLDLSKYIFKLDQFEFRMLSNQCRESHDCSNLCWSQPSIVFKNDQWPLSQVRYFSSLVLTCCLITLAHSQPLPSSI